MNEPALAIRTRTESGIAVGAVDALQAAEKAYRDLLANEPHRFRALCGLAVVRSQLGAPADARHLLTQAAEVARPSVEDHLALGTGFARIKDPERARHHFEQAVRLDERHAEARLHLANVLIAGDVAGAVTQYQTVIAIDPNNAEAHQNLGLVLQRLGQYQSAVTHHEAALAIKPKSAVACISLGDAYRHLERYDDAVAQYERALALDPQLTDAYINLGGTLQVTGRREEAIGVYQRALATNLALPDAHYNLGNVYAELDNLHAAVAHYERSIALNPKSAEAHNNLANVLRKQGCDEKAISHYEHAVRLRPQYAAALRNLGDALQAQNRCDEAIVRHRAALASEPNDGGTLNHLASALLVAGRLDEASRVYEAAIEIAPEDAGIQLNYATVKSFAEGDPRLARLELLAARENALSDSQRIALHFALGKAYADLKDGERSFRHLSLGNALKRRHIAYDERETLMQTQRIRDAFSQAVMRARPGVGHPSQAPVFVVGMPRSGTSLVEQILASHPRVFGAGEVKAFAAATEKLAQRKANAYPEMLGKLSDDDLRELGKSYVGRLSGLGASCDRIVDKMPANFLFLGLIHLALPNARIIHVKRDQVDTCLSCFSLLFMEDQPFAYDLAELGRYYRAYDELMGHWRAVLPPQTLLEVQYEDLVKDLDGHARRLVAHCGLDWNDRCLAFHETRRPVHTASLVQVRRPIYADSVGRWRLYGSRLKPLLDALEALPLPSEVADGTLQTDPAHPPKGRLKGPPKGPLKGGSAEGPTSLSGPDCREAASAPLEAQANRAYLLAKRLQERKDLAIAERLFRFVLEVRPGHYDSLLGMGAICVDTNRLEAAKSYFTQSIAVNGSAGVAHGSLGAVLASAGELDAAVTCYEKALTLAPDHPGIHYAFAMLLQTLERKVEAIDYLRRAIAKRPEHLDSHFALGNLLYAIGKDIEAAQCYLKVLQFSPRHPETHNNLGNVLLRQGHPERAIAYYRTAIEINPAYPDAYGNLGNALLELNRLEESIAQNQRALELKPSRFGSYNNLGVAFQALGRFEEATQAFERALELSPDDALIHLNLANMERFKPGDRRLPGLRRLLGVVDTLDEAKQIGAHFAVGKALTDLKQYDEAFQHLLQGNALKRKTFVYDEAQMLAMLENLKTKFSPELFRSRSGCGDSSWSPIFIVGMPRSGTTLLEQVLASHSKVFGAGELETFKEVIGECAKTPGVPPAYPDLVDFLSPEQILQIGQTYSTRARALAPDADHIVDKMPLNFVFAGLIHLALPKARIIHIRRDPLDTCVSCFSLLFTGSQPFAYDLAELGRYYRGYETAMEHWHRVLPPGVMMDVQYEELVEDLEGVSRTVLQHCGLEWEDTCRDFHDTKRTVRTASLMQVREPLYRSSIGGWRRYAKHLKPLADSLGQDVPARLAADA
jgi:tetratricopeptide (TPR) repeat protein